MRCAVVALAPLVLAGCLLEAERDFPRIDTACSEAPPCPGDMARVWVDRGHVRSPGYLIVEDGPCVCVDRYEASSGAGGAAVSAPGRPPWTRVSFEDAQRACGLAGKRLCTAREWTAACTGLPAAPFPYGAEYLETACNTTSTVAATGSFSVCEGGWPDLFDMSGNVAEWTGSADDPASCDASLGCGAHGGAYGSVPSELACNYRAGFTRTSTAPTIGFRCCKT